MTYDALRRLTGVNYGVSGETSESSIAYTYDNANRLTKATDSTGGEYTLTYDNFNRLTDVEGPNGSVGYEYDGAGRRTLMEVPGRSVSYEYDNANRLTKLTSSPQTVSLAYDKADQLQSLTLPNGIKQLYSYDKAGHATSIAYKNGESTLGEINYAYDVNGHTEEMSGSYARLGLPEVLKSTKYNAANQQTEREGKAFTYDAAGNLTKDNSNEYTWNARGQLTKISGASTASFGYDPFGRRSWKTLSGTTTKLLYDNANVAQESVGESVTANILTGLRADQLFSRTTGAGTSSYLTNRLGSTIGLANGSAEVKATYTYDPFGGMVKSGEATDNPYQFTGRENDATGLQYNRARYYNPSMGRFISPDPARFVDGPNLYTYTGSAPLDFTDPSGRCSSSSGYTTIAEMVACAERRIAEWQQRIGEWVGCGDEVSSNKEIDPLKMATDAAQDGLLGAKGGWGGVARGAGAGALKSGGLQWLEQSGCGRLATWLEIAFFVDDVKSAGDNLGHFGPKYSDWFKIPTLPTK
jgi:RHS repeat-associated protein